MAFDWKKLDRDERRRQDRLAFVLGLSYTVLGVVGLGVMLATRSTRLLGGIVVYLGFGLVLLGITVGTRLRKPD